MYSRGAFESQLDEAFEEAFDGVLDEHGERDEDYEVPQYWQDTITELADAAIPIYSYDRVELWQALGMPEVDDPGLIDGVTDVLTIMATAIYEEASQYLYELANKYGFN